MFEKQFHLILKIKRASGATSAEQIDVKVFASVHSAFLSY